MTTMQLYNKLRELFNKHRKELKGMKGIQLKEVTGPGYLIALHSGNNTVYYLGKLDEKETVMIGGDMLLLPIDIATEDEMLKAITKFPRYKFVQKEILKKTGDNFLDGKILYMEKKERNGEPEINIDQEIVDISELTSGKVFIKTPEGYREHGIFAYRGKNYIHEIFSDSRKWDTIRSIVFRDHIVRIGYRGKIPGSELHEEYGVVSILHPATEKQKCSFVHLIDDKLMSILKKGKSIPIKEEITETDIESKIDDTMFRIIHTMLQCASEEYKVDENGDIEGITKNVGGEVKQEDYEDYEAEYYVGEEEILQDVKDIETKIYETKSAIETYNQAIKNLKGFIETAPNEVVKKTFEEQLKMLQNKLKSYEDKLTKLLSQERISEKLGTLKDEIIKVLEKYKSDVVGFIKEIVIDTLEPEITPEKIKFILTGRERYVGIVLSGPFPPKNEIKTIAFGDTAASAKYLAGLHNHLYPHAPIDSLPNFPWTTQKIYESWLSKNLPGWKIVEYIRGIDEIKKKTEQFPIPEEPKIIPVEIRYPKK